MITINKEALLEKKISQVKEIASNVILEKYPLWKQQNLLSGYTNALKDIEEAGVTLSEIDKNPNKYKALYIQFDNIQKYNEAQSTIQKIRDWSNNIEKQLASLELEKLLNYNIEYKVD